MSNKRVLVIPDLHIPYHHRDAFKFLKKVRDKLNPSKIVCLGDELDKQSLSFHDSDPDLLSAGDELRLSIKKMKKLYKLFPEVNVVHSNHGSMVYRKGKHHGIPRKYLRDYEEILEAPSGWRWSEDLTLRLPNGQSCFFQHSLSTSVRKAVALRGMCIVQGHYHTKFELTYLSNPDNLLWGITSGCLIDRKSLAYAYDKAFLERPILGCSAIINSYPVLIPMVLDSDGNWTGKLYNI